MSSIDQLQTFQVSRILRETHATWLVLTLTRIEGKFSRILKNLRKVPILIEMNANERWHGWRLQKRAEKDGHMIKPTLQSFSNII